MQRLQCPFITSRTSSIDLRAHPVSASDVTETYAIKNSWIMKAEDTISTLQRLREGNGEAVVEKGREEERTEESLASDYFMHPSIERDRRLLDEKQGEWIARRMEIIVKETKERLLGMGVEYRVNLKADEKKPVTKTPEEVKKMLGEEQCYKEVLLACEVREWEKLFWNKFKAFLDQIDKDRVEEKERLTREWKADCWRRLNPQMHAAQKRIDVGDMGFKDRSLEILGEQWALSISQLFEGVEKPNNVSIAIQFEGMDRRLHESGW